MSSGKSNVVRISVPCCIDARIFGPLGACRQRILSPRIDQTTRKRRESGSESGAIAGPAVEHGDRSRLLPQTANLHRKPSVGHHTVHDSPPSGSVMARFKLWTLFDTPYSGCVMPQIGGFHGPAAPAPATHRDQAQRIFSFARQLQGRTRFGSAPREGRRCPPGRGTPGAKGDRQQVAHRPRERPQDSPPLQVAYCLRESASGNRYLIPTTIESGPTNASVRADEKPASSIQPAQSAPLKSKPPGVSISMLRLIIRPKAFFERSSSMMDS